MFTIKLYQANVTADYAFRCYTAATKTGGPKPEDYTKVWEETVNHKITSAGDVRILEDLFGYMNQDDRPGRDKFRSMSVSDIVATESETPPFPIESDSKTRTYYCDTVSFIPIAFDGSKAAVL